MQQLDLPAPDPQSALQAKRVAAHLRRLMVAKGGSVDFSDFMEAALYAPGLGYYVAGRRKLGPEGDFVTAPEISPLFACALANSIAPVLTELGDAVVLEFGAGSGVLAVDLLKALGRLGALPRRYLILEPSPDLRASQRRACARLPAALADRVMWLERWPETPLRGVLVANEVLDAMPVRRFRITPEGARPLRVGMQGEEFRWCLGSAETGLSALVRAIEAEVGEPLAVGYESEFSALLQPWLATLAEHLEAGTVLLFDYGYERREYYHPQRSAGTLVCHYRHRVHYDPLVLPGLQDISASVDFSALARAGKEAGLTLAGYTTQAWFLLNNQVTEILACTDRTDLPDRLAMSRALKTLTLPGEMGERFKCMAFSRNCRVAPAGFEDQARRQIPAGPSDRG